MINQVQVEWDMDQDNDMKMEKDLDVVDMVRLIKKVQIVVNMDNNMKMIKDWEELNLVNVMNAGNVVGYMMVMRLHHLPIAITRCHLHTPLRNDSGDCWCDAITILLKMYGWILDGIFDFNSLDISFLPRLSLSIR